MTLIDKTILVVLGLIVLFATPVVAEQVSVMHGWPAQQGEAFDNIVEAFEDKHKHIDVVVEVVVAQHQGAAFLGGAQDDNVVVGTEAR